MISLFYSDHAGQIMHGCRPVGKSGVCWRGAGLLRGCWVIAFSSALVAAFPLSWGEELLSELPAVTPYRPSVSTPAALSAPGWLEAEAGLLRVGNSVENLRESLPYSLKLAFSADWGIRVAGEVLVRGSNAQGETATGFGDTSLVLKRRFAMNDHSAFGLELGAGFSTARAELGSGSGGTDVSVNGIYSADIGVLHTDVNRLVTRLARVATDESQLQTLYAAALSGNLNARWGIVGELSGTRQRGTDPTAQGCARRATVPHARSPLMGVWQRASCRAPRRGRCSWVLQHLQGGCFEWGAGLTTCTALAMMSPMDPQ